MNAFVCAFSLRRVAKNIYKCLHFNIPVQVIEKGSLLTLQQLFEKNLSLSLALSTNFSS